MATIQETLHEINQIQKEFDNVANDESLVKEFMNFTSIIYFDYLAHSVLDRSRMIDLSKITGSSKYYELFSQPEILLEYIRISNIGQFSFIWNAYEKYLRGIYKNDFGLKKFKIKDIFDDLIKKIKPVNYLQIIEEFEVMRNSRNSLHDGGIYNSKFIPFKGVLCNKEFTFSPGNPVEPLRIMDVIKTMWNHYKAFERMKVN